MRSPDRSGSRGVIAVGLLALTTIFAWPACAPKEDVRLAELAAGCSINSDCTSPLVCAYRTCHVQCETSRDCPDGARCVVSDRPFHVCQLPSETRCTSHANCPAGMVCGLDGECRDQCRTSVDCVPGQICTSGTCAEKSELVDGGLSAMDTGTTTATTGGRGQPCEYTSECPIDLVCRNGFCADECLGSRDCARGETCVARKCVVLTTEAGSYCSPELTECWASGGSADAGADASPSHYCTDLITDRDNCGLCRKQCGDGEICAGGTCVASCPASQTLCSGVCRELATDRLNCGTCGNTCRFGEFCVKGACSPVCAAPAVDCSGSCVDLATSRYACGACGKTCAAGEACVKGACVVACTGGATACTSGGTTTCRDLSVDPANCGVCGNVCTSGICVPTGITEKPGACK